MRQHEAGEQAQKRRHDAQRGEQRLRMQQQREQGKKAQEKHHQRVAAGAQLERFERQQQHDQVAAG